LEFSRRHHFRNDVVIAAAGPFRVDEVIAIITPHLPKSFHDGTQSPRFDRHRAEVREIHDGRETEQLQLALAWHAPGRHSESRHALMLLSTMLGETASSRLFMELREERGLCYQISSDVTFFDETGAFEISAGLDPESRAEALACISREIDDLVRNGPRPGELERAKRLTIAQSKLAFESTSAHAAWAGEGLLDFGRIPCPTEWRARIMAVTDAQVKEVAAEVFLGKKPALAEIGAL
jgi:predicted Zn-dependent peptidase